MLFRIATRVNQHAILSSALNHEIKLWVTSEFVRELERHSSNFENDPVLEFAKNLPTLSELQSEIIRSLIDDIKGVLSPNAPKNRKQRTNEVSDLIHLASCIHHRAYGFITRDTEILKHARELHQKYNLRIISPTDLSDSYEDGDTRRTSVTVAIGGQEIRVSELDEHRRNEAERFLVGLGIGTDSISSCLTPGTTRSPRIRLVVQTGREIIGMGSWSARHGAGQDKTMYLYLNEDHPNSDHAINHLLASSIIRCSYGTIDSP